LLGVERRAVHYNTDVADRGKVEGRSASKRNLPLESTHR